jgi:hypothetical protein
MSVQIPLDDTAEPKQATITHNTTITSLRAKIAIICIIICAVIGIVELVVTNLRGCEQVNSTSIVDTRKLLKVILDIGTGAVWSGNATMT